MKEIWKDIKGYEGLYQISNWGNIKSLKRNHKNAMNKVNRIRTLDKSSVYARVTLWNINKTQKFSIHRLVAMAFIPNPESKPEVNHKDGNKLNNRSDNLEWVTKSENANHAIRNGLYTPVTKHLIPAKKGSDNINARAMAQYTLTGKLFKIWETQTQAEKAYGFYRGALWNVCRRKNNIFKGFQWRYYDR